jgi:hypothetical protein
MSLMRPTVIDYGIKPDGTSTSWGVYGLEL